MEREKEKIKKTRVLFATCASTGVDFSLCLRALSEHKRDKQSTCTLSLSLSFAEGDLEGRKNKKRPVRTNKNRASKRGDMQLT